LSQLAGSFGYEQAHLPVPSMVAQCDRGAICRPDSAMRTQDQKLRIQQVRGAPAHPGVLGHPKKISGGLSHQHFGRDRKLTFRAARVGFDPVEYGGTALQHLVQGNGCVWAIRHAYFSISAAASACCRLGESWRKNESPEAQINDSDISRYPAFAFPVTACSQPTN